MPFNFDISRIRKSINKESLYVLMLSFILLFNASLVCAQKIPGMKESFIGRRVFGFHLLRSPDREDGYALPEIKEDAFWEKASQRQIQLPLLISIFGFLIMAVLSLGLYLDIRILVAKLRKRQILKRRSRHLKINWRISDIFKLAIIFVFLGYIFHIMETNILSSFSKAENLFSFIPFLNTGILDLLLLGFIVYFVRVKYSQGLAALGLKFKDTAKNIALAILSYIAFLPLLILVLLIVVMIAAIFNYQPPQQAIFKLFLQEKRFWFLIYSTTIVVLLGPVVEEVFFRAFAYNALKKRWGVPRAMALTAVVFAALHGTLIGFLPIAALGFLLVYMYEKTGSLIPSITIHILHNGLMVGFLFLGRYLMGFSR